CIRLLATVIAPLSLHDALPIWLTALVSSHTATGAAARPRTAPHCAPLRGTVENIPWRGGRHSTASCMAMPARKALFMALLEKMRSEEHTSELQSRFDLVCRLLL